LSPRVHWYIIAALASLTVGLQALGFPHCIIYVSLLSSAIGLGTHVNFESLAKKYISEGRLAGTSTKVLGRSGVKHSFAFSVSGEDGEVQVVADTALSVSEVDEVKVLGFYAKVYDVKPKAAILCVSPKLSPGASELAKQYGLHVIEQERPRELIPMLATTIDKILGAS
jgi:hypothetical protein